MRPTGPKDGIAWITGASSGIGLALARRLLDEGWTVALTARRAAELQSVASAYPESRALVFPADVRDAGALAAIAERLEAEGRPIALAIAGAGIYARMGLHDLDPARLAEVFAVNLAGAVHLAAAALPGMRRRRAGQLVFIGSAASLLPLPASAAYGASKAALRHFAAALRFEAEEAGILVQIVSPGFVTTPMTAPRRRPGPFQLSAEEAAGRIRHGLGTRRFEIAFPRRLLWPMKIAALLPWPVLFRLRALMDV
jgi:short-subunit dehydrogenase